MLKFHNIGLSASVCVLIYLTSSARHISPSQFKARRPIEAFDSGDTYPVPKKFLKKRKKYCVAKIKGTSMTEAGISDGSYVLLEVNETPVSGAIVLARYGNKTTLKRLREKEDGDWELMYEDGSDAIIPLKDGEWEVIGHYVKLL